METKTRKITVVGDGFVGKTCLLIRYKDKEFAKGYIPTVFDNYECETYVDGNHLILSLYDTAGQEEYDRIRLLSYPDTDVFLVCFDITNESSFANIPTKWIPELKANGAKENCSEPCIVLVGTKADLREDEDTKNKLIMEGKKMVTEKEARDLCRRIQAIKYIECSAMTGHMVREVFEEAARLSLQEVETGRREKARCCIVM